MARQGGDTVKMQLESTSKIVELEPGEVMRCRIWEGTSEQGTPIVAMVVRVAARSDHDQAELQRDLLSTRPPSAEVAAWPARMIL
jgi:hypothetical protein